MNRLLQARRCSRRDLLRAGALLTPAALLPWPVAAATQADSYGDVGRGFKGIAGSRADTVRVPPGYRAEVLLRWGDALWPDVPRLDARRLRRGSLLEPAPPSGRPASSVTTATRWPSSRSTQPAAAACSA
jgi:secreted PhoX family phosphatase